jgi:MFS family permease
MKKWRLGKAEIDLPLIALCLNNFLLNASTSVIAPFYPPLATGSNTRYHLPHLHLSSTSVGFVISMNPIGGFIFGVLVSQFMQKIGRRNLMWISLFTTVITLIMLGASYYLNNHPNWFLAVGLISRFFMGAARAGYGATTFAYAPLLWPDKVKRMIGILESCTGKAEKIASPLFINIIILHYRYK